ncbi:alpha/beta fold hydrolase [Rhodococcus sp. LW-XY12]|uniref:alpha/beta fold hydrolase n=1 Tax=Rhodococcus sp. LW-XY12 TaxID=2856851 RepID=UPI001C57E353|nr:hypothetical protein [Rhodococcus sp. LW-XY12]QXU53859.1 hypothetical protein KXC42_00500 [Rhodococcus sp. LW-XY12]
MDPPVTRYLPRDGHNPAYGVAGTGPTDVVWFFEVQMHLDLLWTDPYMHSLFERLATCSRAVCFQRRGFGLSDPVDHVPTIEQQAEDVPAVMDAEQIRHATLIEDRPDRPGSRRGNPGALAHGPGQSARFHLGRMRRRIRRAPRHRP